MEIRPYSNQDKPLLDVFEILPEDRKIHSDTYPKILI